MGEEGETRREAAISGLAPRGLRRTTCAPGKGARLSRPAMNKALGKDEGGQDTLPGTSDSRQVRKPLQQPGEQTSEGCDSDGLDGTMNGRRAALLWCQKQAQNGTQELCLLQPKRLEGKARKYEGWCGEGQQRLCAGAGTMMV